MKFVNATVNGVDNGHIYTIPALRAEVEHTFGSFAVILPSANFDMESFRKVSPEERKVTTKFFNDLAKHLYENMGGADFRNLKTALDKYSPYIG